MTAASWNEGNVSRRMRRIHGGSCYNGGMTWVAWLNDNWFTGLQSLAILSGFIFTCVTLRREDRSRRVSNLLLLTANHRELTA